jgi:hypothetical protein
MKKLAASLAVQFPNLLGSSPLTSIVGYLAAILSMIYPILTTGDFEFKRDWVSLVVAAYAAIKGRIGKDSNGVTAIQGAAMKHAIIEDDDAQSIEDEEEVVEPEPEKPKKRTATKPKIKKAVVAAIEEEKSKKKASSKLTPRR